MTLSISSYYKVYLLSKLIFPTLLRASIADITPCLIRQWGVYQIQEKMRMRAMREGAATKKHQFILQLSIIQQNRVITNAPIVKNICTITEYFCRFLFPTVSANRQKVMLMATSHPQPLRNRPTAIMQTLKPTATMMVPRVHSPHEARSDILRPKLSAKNEITKYPTRAPIQGQLLRKSIVADYLQRYFSLVAIDEYELSSTPKKFDH